MLETFQSDSFGIKWVAQSSGRKSQDPSSRVSFRDNSSLRVFISFFRSLLFSLLFCVFQNFFRGREHLIIFSGQFEPKNVPIFSREISLRKRNEQTTDRISLPFLCPINVLQKSSFFMLKTYLECSRLKIVRKIPSLFRC